MRRKLYSENLNARENVEDLFLDGRRTWNLILRK
jgi:hypothetical protein